MCRSSNALSNVRICSHRPNMSSKGSCYSWPPEPATFALYRRHLGRCQRCFCIKIGTDHREPRASVSLMWQGSKHYTETNALIRAAGVDVHLYMLHENAQTSKYVCICRYKGSNKSLKTVLTFVSFSHVYSHICILKQAEKGLVCFEGKSMFAWTNTFFP